MIRSRSGRLRPTDAPTIVRERDTKRLVAQTDISPTGAENFVDHDDLREQVVKLELFCLLHQPIIELNDGGWKSLNQMSDSQQCTALLSITMIERDIPLIIDQPEDVLGNQSIFLEVVSLLRDINHDHEIITATHNANIPVLGDAEQIIVMRSNGQEGFFRPYGWIDDHVTKNQTRDFLEGSEQAFRGRDDKYRQSDTVASPSLVKRFGSSTRD
ncbi:hypothetical protein ACFPYI_08660 [Halomarina salina]|uniref:ATPase AAA-type core domain-containing protein n=1 Tax=Halomarina salina TaxID=1872699 RepID=A0ABD5RLD4_9EURY|nr:hypothetical protein [Halomarina salina]